MMRIIVKHNDTPIKTYQFDSDVITVGRLATNSIPINSMGVSRHHLKIERNGSTGLMDVKDLGSLNGCFINNQKIDVQAIESATDVVLGKYSLHIEFTDHVATPAPIPMQVEEPSTPQTQSIPEITIADSSTSVLDIEEDSKVNSATATSEHTSDLILDEMNILEEEATPDSNFVFSKSQKKLDEELPEELDPPTVNAVLIDLNRQAIFKINKHTMIFGSDKSADIFVESGVFSSDNLATVTAENDVFTISKGNGKLKVNGKKCNSQILVHKDKIKVDSGEFSFMIKDS